MYKKIISAVLIIAIVLTPFLGCLGIAFLTPSVYHNTFLAGLSTKYSRLTSVQSPKIVVVGGSSVAFGLDSEQLEAHLGHPAVNFGLYASLGSKVMLDLSRDAVNPGDIVVLAFETNNQTLSTYFNAESMWQAVDCDHSLLLRIDGGDYGKMLGGLYDFVKNKLNFLKNGAPDFEGIYHSSSFDAYGDICYPRPGNIMPAGFDTNNTVEFESIVIEDAFAEYVNAYIRDVQKRGASVVLSYCPMNALSVLPAEDTGKAEYAEYLSSTFHCPMISDIDDYIFDSAYFYDTNFHLNDYGTFFRTKQLASDLASYFDLTYTDVEQPDEEVPGGPDQNEAEETVDDSAFAECFTYEDFHGAGLAISGTTELAAEYTELAIPQECGGEKVVAILSGAFSGCDQLTQIRISRAPGDPIVLNDGAFSGAENLQKVILEAEPTDVSVSTQGLLEHTSDDLRFYVEKSLYAKYVTDYYWSIYSESIKLKK